MSRKRTKNLYWGEREENAIIQYNASTNEKEREKIFREIIYPGLHKIAENIYHRFKFRSQDSKNFEDIIQDALALVSSKVYRFDPTKCSVKYKGLKTKAFGYFSTIIKNHYMQRTSYNERINEPLVPLTYHHESGDDQDQFYIYEDWHPSNFDYNEYYTLLKQWWKDNYEKVFDREEFRKIAKTIVKLMYDDNDIRSRKKDIYHYIKTHLPNCRVNHLRYVFKNIHVRSAFLKTCYLDTGVLPEYSPAMTLSSSSSKEFKSRYYSTLTKLRW